MILILILKCFKNDERIYLTQDRAEFVAVVKTAQGRKLLKQPSNQNGFCSKDWSIVVVTAGLISQL
jgi:protein-tyrosine phosphatase